MNITYEQFKNLVPKETAEFVDFVLPYLDRYLKEGRKIKFRGTDHESQSYYSKSFFVLLYGLDRDKEYSSFLRKYGFDSSRIKFEAEYISFDGDKSKMFEDHCAFFTIYDDLTLYRGLSPIDIIVDAVRNYRSKCDTIVFSELFSRITLDSFASELVEMHRVEKEALSQEVEKTEYTDLSISVISYLEMATKIRTVLYEILNNHKSEILSKTEEDIVPLSLLIALFYYKDVERPASEEITDQVALKEFLKEKGVTAEGINQAIGISINSRSIGNTPKNVYCIKDFYARYYQDGVNKDIPASEITIPKILANVFNRNFTRSLVIEKVFAKQNCYLGSITSLEDSIEQLKANKKHEYSLEYVKSFYSELSKETRDFIDFTAKAYILILEKMKAKEHNTKYLFNEDDADTLALYIATAYHGGEVAEFFTDHGVTLEKILALLNLEISKEEIEQTELDQKILVDRFKRFVYEGVNRNKYARNIKISDISYNLCSRDFNRTMILENLFDDLTDTADLQRDFLEQLQKHLENKEKLRKRNLTQKLFRDMPAQSMEYLELASRVHQYLEKQNIPYSDADIRSFSLLLAISLTNAQDLKGFFESINLSYSQICGKLSLSHHGYTDFKEDIDLLVEEYGPYIFGGVNQELERKDLSIYNISRNIFNKALNNSVDMSRFLAQFDLDYEYFENFATHFQAFLENTKERRRMEEAKNVLSSYHPTTSLYIKFVLRLYKRILKAASINENLKQKIRNESDAIELAFVLGLFLVSNEARYFFEKNNITLDNILTQLGLDPVIMEGVEHDDIDYMLLLNEFEPFIKKEGYSHNVTIADLVKKIFEPSFSKNSLVLEELSASLGSDYNILKEEVETKRDYELSLTVDDRIALLAASDVDALNLGDVKSILHFGNSLAIHSKYIHDELPKLMMGDAHDKSIATISEIIDRVYTTQTPAPKKRGFFSQLFAISVEEDKPKVVINPEAVKELKESIDANITALSQELLGYDAIRKYIEVYRRKNRSHLFVASGEVEKMQEKVNSLSPHNEDEYADFLMASSHLQIMQDKANRFATSNHLMKQELLKVNQAIVNHFITINALQMARDDLFPLIGSELALSQGRATENQALDLSQNVIELFQSLLTRNVDGAVANLERLKQSSLPDGVYEALNRDIEVYLKGINQVKAVPQSIEALDIDPVATQSYTPTLTLEGSLPDEDPAYGSPLRR